MAEFDKYEQLEIMRRHFETCSEFMQAVGDSSRQRILLAIMDGDFGGSRVGAIAQKANLSAPAVSHHLKILMDAGIVARYSKGTMNFYYIDVSTKAFEDVRAFITSFQRVADEFAKIQNYDEEKQPFRRAST